MSGLINRGGGNGPTALSGVQLQSSSYGLTIPVVYGMTRVVPNLVWYGAFRANSQGGGGGKGGGSGNSSTTYSYYASVVIALCEGQVGDVPTVWRSKAKFKTQTPTTVFTVIENYVVPAGGGSYAVAHSGVFVAAISVSTAAGGGEDSTLPVFYSEGRDFQRYNGLYTFPTALAGKGLSITYQYFAGGTAGQALSQMGLGLISGAVGQATWTYLTTQQPAYAIPYSGLALVVGQNYLLDSSASLENHNFEVVGPGAYSIAATIPDADPAVFTKDLLVNNRYGAAFPTYRVGDTSLWSSYCRAFGLWMSPVFDTQQSASAVLTLVTQLTNTAIVWSDGALKFVPYGDVAQTANGATYTPNVTPVYSLDDSAFICNTGEEPVTVTRKAPEDCFNSVKVQMRNRANDYNQEIIEAREQGAILTYGWRPMPIISAQYFCDYNAAIASAQLILQRQFYTRNTFEFKLPWQYCLLEPMDLVTITDPGLGLAGFAVRVIEIAEADDGELTITAEEYPAGIAHAAQYNPTAGLGFSHDYNTSPGNISAPQFFEPPTSRTVTGLEVWAAVQSSSASWGGCEVWVSFDGLTYRQAGEIVGPGRYGALTGPIAANSLPIVIGQGQLISVSATDSQNLSSLLWIGGASWEFLAYQTAVLTGTEAYSLTGLTRGAFGTNAAAVHAAGDPVVRVDQSIGKSGPLDLGLIGQTIYFKFPSFNVYGGGLQSLAAVPDYPYTITGTMAKLPPAAPSNVVANYEYSGIRIVWTPSTSQTVALYEVRYGASFAGGTLIGQVQGQSYLWAVQPATTYQLWVAAVDRFGNYSQAALAITSVVAPSGIQSPTTQIVDNNILFYWAAPATGSLPIAHYAISKGATYATAAAIGLNGPSTFFTYFESAAGTYTYWIVPIDTADNYGAPVQIVATVSAPPDYVLRADYFSTFPGTIVNGVVANGMLLAPVNAGTTWQTHFTGNGYTSPNDQLLAGVPLYLGPTLTTGSYTEVIDYGSLLPPTTITVTPTIATIAGSVTTVVTISYSSDSVTYTSGGAGLSAILAPAFRYVKINLAFTATGIGNLIQVQRLETKLNVKQRRDSGTGTATATDTHAANASTGSTTGTFVPFNYPFISANPPQVTPVSAQVAGSPIYVVVDYLGPANPTGFGVTFYNASGVRVATTFTWSTSGY